MKAVSSKRLQIDVVESVLAMLVTNTNLVAAGTVCTTSYGNPENMGKAIEICPVLSTVYCIL